MTVPVDLRSDTVTRPTAGMRRAMAEAEVGDDVFGEDPSVRALEIQAAALLDHEAALFVPSGTMGNQIAIHLACRSGDDVLLEATSHVYLYELGAMAAWSGAMPRVIHGSGGRIALEQLERSVAGEAYYLARPALLILENTHNHAGGVLSTPEDQAPLVEFARRLGIPMHLDGARLFNAAVALGRPVCDLARSFDTVMISLSKGLGAPVGSILVGSSPTIARARIVRKRMGGGMRQAGIIAAGGSFALTHHVERLAADHQRAAVLAVALANHSAFVLDPGSVRTNIVIAEVREARRQGEILEALAARGVLAVPMGAGRIRFVTHMDVDDAGISRALEAIQAL